MRLGRRCAPLLACLLASTLLAACSDEAEIAPGPTGQAGEPLPTPGAVTGSITGMPEPGVAPPAAQATVPAPADPPDPGNVAMTLPGDTEPAPEALAAPAAGEPSVEAAVAVLRQYYAAINARDFATAESLWDAGGRGSEAALAMFAGGFDGIDGFSVQLGAPGKPETAPGSRYVTIPAIVEARHVDGTLRRYGGTYTLRAGTDGGQRGSWRIASAGLEERPR